MVMEENLELKKTGKTHIAESINNIIFTFFLLLVWTKVL